MKPGTKDLVESTIVAGTLTASSWSLLDISQWASLTLTSVSIFWVLLQIAKFLATWWVELLRKTKLVDPSKPRDFPKL